MSSRATQTLLVLRADHALRADFGEAGALLNVWSTPRNQAISPADLVRGALGLAPVQGQKIWVLSEDVWTQTLKLQEGAIAGLDEASLASVLAFEAETLCGIPALEASLGFSPAANSTKGERAFHIAVAERMLRDSVQASVEKSGGKLAGILALAALTDAAPEKTPGSDDEMRAWMQAKFSMLLARAGTLPVIHAAVRPTAMRTYVLVAAALWAVVAGASFAHWTSLKRTKGEIAVALDRFSKQNAVVAQVDKKTVDTRKQLADATTENQKRAASETGVQKQLALQRNRLAELLRIVAEARPEDVVVESIASQGASDVTLVGMAVDAAPADDFATRLQQRLKPLGWEVQPAEKQKHQSSTGAELWEFTLKMNSSKGNLQMLEPRPAPLVGGSE